MRYPKVVVKLLGGLSAVAAVFLLSLPASAQEKGAQDVDARHARLAEEVRHELVMLPYYSVFDNLSFEIRDVDTVVLSGQVVRPTLRSDAENAVKRLEFVGKVVNQIEVLPLSTMDDSIRIATYRAIYSKPGLDRYALQAVPPIHIIVSRGHVTLTGVVGAEMDRSLAEIAARGVAWSFSVTNNLRIEGE